MKAYIICAFSFLRHLFYAVRDTIVNWLVFHYMRRKLENYPALTDSEISTLHNFMNVTGE